MKLRPLVTPGIHVAGVALICAFAPMLHTQSTAGRSALGIWRGQSVCLVRPSACNDEIVVYRIAPTTTADSVMIDARKIVRGQEEEMGVLACGLGPRRGEITCVIPQGTWRFSVRADSLTGDVRLRDGTRYREVRAVRAR